MADRMVGDTSGCAGEMLARVSLSLSLRLLIELDLDPPTAAAAAALPHRRPCSTAGIFCQRRRSAVQAANQGRVVDPNITRYSVKVLPFNYDPSPYGFREFFKRHGMYASETR